VEGVAWAAADWSGTTSRGSHLPTLVVESGGESGGHPSSEEESGEEESGDIHLPDGFMIPSKTNR